jgi:hypothetical protein
MAIIPGRYGGYGVRPPRPGSASRMVDPIPEGQTLKFKGDPDTVWADLLRQAGVDRHAYFA